MSKPILTQIKRNILAFDQRYPKSIVVFTNTSEQSSAFSHESGSWASEPKVRTPPVNRD
jgi:hypothetical protein